MAPLEADGAAKAGDPLVRTNRRRFVEGDRVNIDVAGYVHVQIAVAIEVSKRASCMPFHVPAQARGSSDFGESSVAVVLIEEGEADGGDQDIRIAVVIVVRRICAGSPVSIRETRALGDIFEFTVSQIVEQVDTAFGWR